ncbi:hypothetical protein Sjap_024240 [Stephania japonica]|uniref:Uncharacterized protein n=1 Tax=Stephania japonica TaxID=461633 RepID=A0AAP0HJP2_9MAGN
MTPRCASRIVHSDEPIEALIPYQTRRSIRGQESLSFLICSQRSWIVFISKKTLAVLGSASEDEADDLNKGISSISSMIQEVLDRRLDMWEKYCVHSCFVVPEGFSLSKADKSDGTSMDVDVLLDKDLDVQLDSLREKLFLADKEATELRSELQLLEKQFVLSYKCDDYVNEAVQLFEENSLLDLF